MVIGCTDSKSTNLKINQDAKKRHLLVNIADTPISVIFIWVEL